MKILFICSSIASGKGGAERLACETANELSARGHTVALGFKSGQPAYPVLDDVTCITWNNYEDLQKEYIKNIINYDPEICFVFYYNQEIYDFYKLLYPTKIPFGMQECVHPDRIRYFHWVKRCTTSEEINFERNLIASGCVLIRLESMKYKETFDPLIWEKIEISYNAIKNANNFSNLQNPINNKFNIINIGGTKKNKNLPVLLKAFSLLKNYHKNWNIIVCGEYNVNSDYYKYLLTICNELKIVKNVIFLGRVDDIYSVYEKCHIHITASLSESFGMCVAESMVHGLPTIAFSRCPGVNELIKNRHNGLLIDHSDDVQGMKNALEELILNIDLRVKIGQNSIVFSRIFDYKNIFDHWEKILNKGCSYKNNMHRLIEEQMKNDYEKALHFNRIRYNHFLKKI